MLHRRRGSSGGGNGAAAGAQQWQSECEGEGFVGARVCAKGCGGCPGGACIGPGGEGKCLLAAMAMNGHSALIANQERGVKEVKLPNDGGRE
jgi:hypothetical protein